ncbi:MAG: hypothetical protein GTO63_16890 [Anaerolineae bacterium]|nr:hypothetical protein [Anaerolineae bacterium]NIN96476.1 hypothetical protein [Anaerolineae bacterium]NIQ79504.1 hypothetical protein [Anaerolineae bacterium]
MTDGTPADKATPETGAAQPGTPDSQAPQAPSAGMLTKEQVERIVSERVGQVVRQRNQAYQERDQIAELLQQQQQAAQPELDEDEKFFTDILNKTLEARLGPMERALNEGRARQDLDNYFAGTRVPEDIKQEIADAYLSGVVQQGYAGQVTIDDVASAVIGARVKEDFLRKVSEAQVVNQQTDAANQVATAEGGNTAPPESGDRAFEDLSLEEKEAVLRQAAEEGRLNYFEK